jgi:hypothetical protein
MTSTDIAYERVVDPPAEAIKWGEDHGSPHPLPRDAWLRIGSRTVWGQVDRGAASDVVDGGLGAAVGAEGLERLLAIDRRDGDDGRLGGDACSDQVRPVVVRGPRQPGSP